MRQLNVLFVCLSLVAVSCTIPEPLGGQCANDLALGDVDCQCVSPDTRYSEGSLGYVDPKEKNLWHCSNEFGSVRVELGPFDVYACHNYRCATYTCAENEMPNKDKLECVKKAVCGEHEDYLAERNTCVCKEPDYVKIGDQCVASVESTCDTAKEVYHKSSNTCSCNADGHWTGDAGSCTCADGYVEIMKRCVGSREDTCDTFKEVFDEEYNLCVCDAEGQWTGDVGECRCTEGYVEIDGRCVGSLESSCAIFKEVFDPSLNVCLCNAELGWIGEVGACRCPNNFVPVGGRCVESVESTCDTTKEVYDVSSNVCRCSDNMHWAGTAGSCTCATGYVEIGGQCVGSREETCDKTKEAFDPSHNLCVCNAAGNWAGTAGACVCKDGFVPVANVCMKKVSCNQPNEAYDATANVCICNAPYFRVNGKCVASGSLVVGDLVEFGRYPQDENSDIPSPLTWQVLEIKADAVLMISQYVLEQYQYHDKSEDITWEKSNVRSYLNALSGRNNQSNIDHTADGFFKNAFGAEEQSRIKEVTNKNPNAPEDWWSTPGGNDTKDKVFLLSHDEVLQYFPTYKSQVASPTAYAIHPPEDSGRRNLETCKVTCSDTYCSSSACSNRGVSVQACSDAQCGSLWWLRSPGNNASSAAYIYVNGGVSDGNGDVRASNVGLRPALYVRLSSEF